MNRNFAPKRKIIEMQLWKTGGKFDKPSRPASTGPPCCTCKHIPKSSGTKWTLRSPQHGPRSPSGHPWVCWKFWRICMMLVTLTHWILLDKFLKWQYIYPIHPHLLFHKTKVETSPELQLHHEVEILATVIVARHNVPSWARKMPFSVWDHKCEIESKYPLSKSLLVFKYNILFHTHRPLTLQRHKISLKLRMNVWGVAKAPRIFVYANICIYPITLGDHRDFSQKPAIFKISLLTIREHLSSRVNTGSYNSTPRRDWCSHTTDSCGHGESKTIRAKIDTSWWFQPIWKIFVKLDHFPQVGVKIKNIWNHQPGYIYNCTAC